MYYFQIWHESISMHIK